MIFADILIKDYVQNYYEDIKMNYIHLENCNGSKYFSIKERNTIESYRVCDLFLFNILYNKVRDEIKERLLTSYEEDIEEIVKLAIEDILVSEVSKRISDIKQEQEDAYKELKSNFFIHFE